ncbi:uncharacterized protein LOC134271888 [Saccostrea cucullata]|uniref:uncharacterized protein LOC134271888 n=1 Tax=Saccostrea cuccullata TaxID=36930 RepID=UPI002ED45430
MIKNTEPWRPECVYSSPYSRNLLVGMFNYHKKTSKVIRYNENGHVIQAIQRNNTGQELYKLPTYIEENRNGDVIVSDFIDLSHGTVVVTDRDGRYRFTYRGPQSGSKLSPRGICTDAFSNILVCDYFTDTIQMVDKDGNYLSSLLTRLQGIDGPVGLSYDDKSHLLWVASWKNNSTICAYRYINRQNYLTL